MTIPRRILFRTNALAFHPSPQTCGGPAHTGAYNRITKSIVGDFGPTKVGKQLVHTYRCAQSCAKLDVAALEGCGEVFQ